MKERKASRRHREQLRDQLLTLQLYPEFAHDLSSRCLLAIAGLHLNREIRVPGRLIGKQSQLTYCAREVEHCLHEQMELDLAFRLEQILLQSIEVVKLKNLQDQRPYLSDLLRLEHNLKLWRIFQVHGERTYQHLLNPVRARHIVSQHFPSLDDLVTATEAEIRSINGIGNKTIYDLDNLLYSHALSFGMSEERRIYAFGKWHLTARQKVNSAGSP